MGIQSSNQLLASSRSTTKSKTSRARAIVAASLAILLSSLVAPAAAFDQGNLRETGPRQQPVVMGVASSSIVTAGDWVLITGSGFDQVTAVFVDATKTEHLMQSSSRLSILIPEGANPGDAVLRLEGDYGSISKQYLFEVIAQSESSQSADLDQRVTVGTFQGYAAVYTKNFKGYSLKISIADKERLIEELDSNYTQNLTKVGVGRTVTVMVYLGNKLVKVQEITIQ